VGFDDLIAESDRHIVGVKVEGEDVGCEGGDAVGDSGGVVRGKNAGSRPYEIGSRGIHPPDRPTSGHNGIEGGGVCPGIGPRDAACGVRLLEVKVTLKVASVATI